jgi:hypothetical protein
VAKLTTSKPKDPDMWGIEQVCAKAGRQFMATGHSDPIPVVAVMSVKKVETEADDELPVHTAVMEFRRLEAVTDPELKRVARAVIDRQAVMRRGVTGVLPFEERNLLDDALGRVFTADDARQERDEFESKVDAELTENDRLRRHLHVVHKFDAVEAFDAGIDDVQRWHDSEHNGPVPFGGGDVGKHAEDWQGWTRLDLETAEADTDGDEPDDPDGRQGDHEDGTYRGPYA